jgi:hypothetical protein
MVRHSAPFLLTPPALTAMQRLLAHRERHPNFVI